MEKEQKEKEPLEFRIMKVASELQLKKDKKNEFLNYNYITPDSIFSAVKPLCVQEKLFLHFDFSKVENCSAKTTTKETYSAAKKIGRATPNVQTELIEERDHFDNVAILTISDIEDLEKKVKYKMQVPDITMNDNAIQGAGAMHTYCMRYLLTTAFLISDASLDIDSGKCAVKNLTGSNVVERSAQQQQQIKPIASEKSKPIASEPPPQTLAQKIKIMQAKLEKNNIDEVDFLHNIGCASWDCVTHDHSEVITQVYKSMLEEATEPLPIFDNIDDELANLEKNGKHFNWTNFLNENKNNKNAVEKILNAAKAKGYELTGSGSNAFFYKKDEKKNE